MEVIHILNINFEANKITKLNVKNAVGTKCNK